MSDEWLTQSAKTRISNLLESRFSESADRIEARISFERYFKTEDSWNIIFAFVRTFALKTPVQMFVYLIGNNTQTAVINMTRNRMLENKII